LSTRQYNLIELRASFPVLCARFLDRLNHQQMVRKFGPDYPEKHEAEVRAMAETYGQQLPLNITNRKAA
jgi:hypothetical protein